jgi:hypothetical protein
MANKDFAVKKTPCHDADLQIMSADLTVKGGQRPL